MGPIFRFTTGGKAVCGFYVESFQVLAITFKARQITLISLSVCEPHAMSMLWISSHITKHKKALHSAVLHHEKAVKCASFTAYGVSPPKVRKI